MKLLPLFLLLLLASCAAPAPADPALAKDINSAYVQATQRAQLAEAKAATLEALSTRKASEAEIALLDARIAATEASLGIAQTQAAATQASDNRQATLIAAQIQATQTAVSIEATRTAIAVAVTTNQEDMIRRQRYQEMVFWGTLIIMCLITFFGGRFLLRLMDWLIEWRDRKNSVFNTTIGPLVFLPDGPQLLKDAYRPNLRLNYDDTNPVEFIGETTAISPMPHKAPDTLNDLAQRLLEMAVNKDPATTILPGWREAKMSSYTWQKVIAALVRAGAVATDPGQGTRLRSYESASMLLADLQAGKVRLE